MDDAKLLLEWRNDPDARAASFTTDVIQLEQHIGWLGRRLIDPDCEMYMAEDGIPVGQVRIDEGVISFSVAKEFRRQGYGRQIIAAIMRPGLVAHVKRENIASQKVFESLNWRIDRVGPAEIVYST